MLLMGDSCIHDETILTHTRALARVCVILPWGHARARVGASHVRVGVSECEP